MSESIKQQTARLEHNLLVLVLQMSSPGSAPVRAHCTGTGATVQVEAAGDVITFHIEYEPDIVEHDTRGKWAAWSRYDGLALAPTPLGAFRLALGIALAGSRQLADELQRVGTKLPTSARGES